MINRKLKTFLVVFVTSTALAFLLRDRISVWPSIVVVNAGVAIVFALLEKYTTKLGKSIVNKFFGPRRKNERPT